MKASISNISKSARRKFLKYGIIPLELRTSSLTRVKLTKGDLGLHIQDPSQQRLWKKLEIYGNYKNFN